MLTAATTPHSTSAPVQRVRDGERQHRREQSSAHHLSGLGNSTTHRGGGSHGHEREPRQLHRDAGFGTITAPPGHRRQRQSAKRDDHCRDDQPRPAARSQ